jgi:hypothetical protein
MPTSAVYLGQAPGAESHFDGLSKPRAAELHLLAQRVCFAARDGTPEATTLTSIARRLERRFEGHFMGHLTRAFALRLLHRDTEADTAWQRATELVSADHPLASVVPDMATWRRTAHQPVLTEEEPGRVYRITGVTQSAGAMFGTLGVGRFLRMASNELIFVNPVPLDDHVLASVRDLGRVAHIIAPAKYHFEHVPAARRAFPDACVWGVPLHEDFARAGHCGFDGFLNDETPLYPGELDQITLDGTDVGDVWLLDRKSRTLITTDALFFPDAAEDGPVFDSAFRRFYAWAWGVVQRPGVPSYQPPMWTNLSAYRGSLERALSLDFNSVAYNHGSWRAIPEQGPARLREVLGFVLGLSRWDGLALTLDFVRRHPSFVARELRARSRSSPSWWSRTSASMAKLSDMI